jgi:tRNA-splicing ligase RtcB
MRKVIDTERIPIKLWLDDIELGALEQAKNLANLPFAFKHIAIMPDSHQGYGMPIGGVLASQGYIVPNAVGVDIGCGMCAVRTSLTEITKEDIKKIMGFIRKSVPLGFNHHKEKQELEYPDELARTSVVENQLEKGLSQVGTLGGGNHFIEIQKGSDGYVWIMIHSGSRNVGFQTANHYAKVAKELNQKYFTSVDPKLDLAFLPNEDNLGQEYFDDMKFCTWFAYQNRRLMLDRVQQAFLEVVETKFEPEINLPHNYAVMENHFGKNVMIHRKGATSAREGEIGIIPGSQGTKSYIVRGKGNKESFESCSHGSGRKMGRMAARRDLNLETEKQRLEEMGVVHSIRNKSDLDEAPSAYKDIAQVMANQTDLVDIVVELTPLGVIKSSDGGVD